MSSGTTTKVRIAVLVNERGSWAAYGFNDFDLDSDISVLEDMMSAQDEGEPSPARGTRLVWVEATVPLPDVADRVVEAEAVMDAVE